MSKSKLSADVPCFVPKKAFQSYNVNAKAFQPNNSNQKSFSSGIPAYMTNCYPFVQEPLNYSNQQWQGVVRPMNAAAIRPMMPYCSKQSHPPCTTTALRNKASNIVQKTSKGTGSSVNDTASHKNISTKSFECLTKERKNVKFSSDKKVLGENQSNFKVNQAHDKSGENIKSSSSNSTVLKTYSQICRSPAPLERDLSKSHRNNNIATKSESKAENSEVPTRKAINNDSLRQNPSNLCPSKSNDTTDRPCFNGHRGASHKHQASGRKTFDKSAAGSYFKSKSVVSYKIPQKECDSSTETNGTKCNKIKQEASNSSNIYVKEEAKAPKPQDEVVKKDVITNSSQSSKISLAAPSLLQDIKHSSGSSIKVLSSAMLKSSPIDQENYPALRSVYKSADFSPIHPKEVCVAGHSTQEQISSGESLAPKLSFSEVLKMAPKRQPEENQKESEVKEKEPTHEPRKKVKKKKKATVKAKKKQQPKARSAIQFNLGGFLDRIEEQKEVIGQVNKEAEEIDVKKPRCNEVRFLAKKENVKPFSRGVSHNFLDSSAPIKRGKEREHPKKKKHSPLKKAILKDRLMRRQRSIEKEQENLKKLEELKNDCREQETAEAINNTTESNLALKLKEKTLLNAKNEVSPEAKSLIHSRRFREYCNQYLDSEIDKTVEMLLSDLVRFQDRQYHLNPVKAKAKRRIALGLKEVTKHVKNGKIKCVIIAPNLEKSQAEGGLDDALCKLRNAASERHVPVVYALSKRRLGALCMKIISVSCVGIFNYDGSEENYKNLMQLSSDARDLYKNNVSSLEADLAELNLLSDENGAEKLSHLTHLQSLSSASTQVTSYRMTGPNLLQKESSQTES